MRIPWKVLGFAARNTFWRSPSLDLGQEGSTEGPLGAGLPRGFLLGTATASHQVEGGNVNDWTDWEASTFPDGRPHIHDRSVSGDAVDSYRQFAADLALMKRLGANAYRLSIEWSRLEPDEDVWREDVAATYASWMAQLRACGIEPMVTLHHFTLPRWVAARGGWMSDATLGAFEAFAGRVATALGSQVDLWCTVNEPNVQAVQGYIKGIWPPGKTDQKLAVEVLARLIEAHARAARALREKDQADADGDGKATRIGIAHHVRVFQPASRSPLDGLVAGFSDHFFNESILEAVQTGRIRLSLPGVVDIDRQVPDLKGSFDYLGLNYYSRDYVRADLKDPALSQQFTPPERPKNDLGWDIYPEGLYLFLKRYAALGLPIYVTENGMADKAGDRRPLFLRQHLRALERAAREGVDVRGYFHWSLLDNFE